MTKALRSINSWWGRHAWAVIGAASVALTFFVSLIVLGQISPPPSAAAQEQTDYARQKDRIDKLESEVENLGKELDQRNATADPQDPAADPEASPSAPDRAQVQLYVPAVPEVTLQPGGGNAENGPSVTPPTPRPSTPTPPEEPTTPAPSPTPDPPSVGITGSLGVDVQSLMEQLSCGLNGASKCR